MSAPVSTPLVLVPVGELDESWVGEQLLVTHSRSDVCSRTWNGRHLPLSRPHGGCTHFGGLSDLRKVGPGVAVLFVGGEQVLVAAGDVVVAAPTPTALEREDDLAASPYDRD